MSRFLPIASIVLIAACAGDATALSDPTAPELNTVSGFWVTTLQVRPADNATSSIYGPLQVAIGTRYPPSPCSSALPAVQSDAGVAFCAVLQNPAEESLQSGVLTIRATPDAEPQDIRFVLNYPPSPCTTLFVGGVLPVSSDLLQSSDKPTVGAEFFTSTGAELVGDYAAMDATPDALQGTAGGADVNPVCAVATLSDADIG